MFSDQFQKATDQEIAKAVREEGYFVCEGALEAGYVDRLLAGVRFDEYQVNRNDVGVVCAGRQRFLSHCLAASRETFDVITSGRVRGICEAYFSDRFKLTNQRIYETHTEAHMPWHTDNNRQSGNRLTAKHSMPGLLFLFYLTDVTENAFQLVKGSERWSPRHDEIYLDDDFIDREHGKAVLTVRMRKGTCIICTIHGVHRAEPFKNAGCSRKTLLFQVDEVGSAHAGHGEKLLVDTAFLGERTPELMDYLGFGFRTEYPPFPSTSVATMAPRDVWAMQRRLLPLMGRALARSIGKALIPATAVNAFKRWRWRNRAAGPGPAPQAGSV